MERCGGVVTEVPDQDILDAKAKVGAGGLGCEPASAASVAGARKLRQEGVIVYRMIVDRGVIDRMKIDWGAVHLQRNYSKPEFGNY